MEIFPLLQARLTVICALVGIITGAFFDGWRVFSELLGKRCRRLSAAVRHMGDFITVVLMGVTVVILCYYFNKGRFRFFCLLGLALGFGLYFFALSGLVVKVYKGIIKVIFSFLSIIFRPVLKIIGFVYRNLQNILYYIVKTLAKRAIWVYNICVTKYVLKKSEKGFFNVKQK